MLCREQDCWGKARGFATDHARFQYFHAEDGYIDYIPHDNFRCEVILLSGLPGMGKDHYIRTLPQDIPVISLDAIRRKYKVSPTDKAANGRVVQEAKEEARSYLRKEQGFVWNATNTSKLMRSQLIDLFLTYGAKVKIVYIEKPYEVWRKQNREREFMVPEAVLDAMLGKLEVPQLGGQMALTELNGDDKIFTHQYIVVGFRPEFKVSKHISLPVTVGINAVRNAYYDGRSLSAFFMAMGREYDPFSR